MKKTKTNEQWTLLHKRRRWNLQQNVCRGI